MQIVIATITFGAMVTVLGLCLIGMAATATLSLRDMKRAKQALRSR